MNNKFLTLIVFLIFVTSEASAVNSKFDGSKKDQNGKLIKRQSYLDFQNALNEYWNSLYPISTPVDEDIAVDLDEKLPEDSNVETTDNLEENSLEPWPTVKLDQNGNPIKVPGYFGHNIFKVGAPLIEIPITVSNKNPEADIALHNGIAPEDFIKVLIAFSNPDWQNEKNISEEIVNMSVTHIDSLSKTEFETYEIAKITDLISDAGEKAFKDGSRQNDIIKDKMEEFFNLVSDDENDEPTADSNENKTSDDVLISIQAEREEIKNLDLSKEEENVILQAQLKTEIEKVTNDQINDLGLTMSSLNNILKDKDVKSGNADEGVTRAWAYISEVKRDLTVNQIALNIGVFKNIIERSGAATMGFDGDAVSTELMTKAIASWDENPGSIIANFLEFSKMLDANAINELAEDFNASARFSIELLGGGDFEKGLKQMQYTELSQRQSFISGAIYEGLETNMDEYEGLNEQISALEQELGLGSSGPTSFGSAYFESCGCTREVTQEDVDNADPVTGQYQ